MLAMMFNYGIVVLFVLFFGWLLVEDINIWADRNGFLWESKSSRLYRARNRSAAAHRLMMEQGREIHRLEMALDWYEKEYRAKVAALQEEISSTVPVIPRGYYPKGLKGEGFLSIEDDMEVIDVEYVD